MTLRTAQYVGVALGLVIGLGLIVLLRDMRATRDPFAPFRSQEANEVATSSPSVPSVDESPAAPVSELHPPMDRADARVTKKPFGLKVSPEQSPVNPERFSGYHTGVDFEAFPEEADLDVPIRAICTGELLVQRTATGYGGVVVQACTLQGQPVTVVYGHLSPTRIRPSVGDVLERGEAFAVLGKGNSAETSGERKHLHLGMHKGTAIDIRGYVSTASALDAWIDPRPLF